MRAVSANTSSGGQQTRPCAPASMQCTSAYRKPMRRPSQSFAQRRGVVPECVQCRVRCVAVLQARRRRLMDAAAGRYVRQRQAGYLARIAAKRRSIAPSCTTPSSLRPPREQLLSQRFPVVLVGFATSRFFNSESDGDLAQAALERQAHCRSRRCRFVRGVWILPPEFHQKLGGARFPEPKLDLGSRGPRRPAVMVGLDQSSNHRPILVALRFFCLNEVWK